MVTTLRLSKNIVCCPVLLDHVSEERAFDRTGLDLGQDRFAGLLCDTNGWWVVAGATECASEVARNIVVDDSANCTCSQSIRSFLSEWTSATRDEGNCSSGLRRKVRSIASEIGSCDNWSSDITIWRSVPRPKRPSSALRGVHLVLGLPLQTPALSTRACQYPCVLIHPTLLRLPYHHISDDPNAGAQELRFPRSHHEERRWSPLSSSFVRYGRGCRSRGAHSTST